MESIAKNSRDYLICSRCIMDTTSDPNLVIDEKGVCNYCKEYDREYEKTKHFRENGEEKLEKLFKSIKEESKNKEYDCALGVSGGVDSSYLLYLCKKYNLRVLAIHVDAGWNSEIAVQNIEKMCNKLGIDLHTVVIDWSTMRELQRAYMFSGLANQDVPQDHCFKAAVLQYCRKYHIKYLLNGANLATEGILSHAFQQPAADWENIKDVYRKCGRGRISLKKYPHSTFWDQYIGYPYLYRVKVIYPLEYIHYSKKMAMDLLEQKFGWRYYGGKHYESRFTKFFQEVYLPAKFGWNKRRDHLSSLIVGGEMTRDEGLQEMEIPTSTEEQLKEETEYILKKLDITDDEWKGILNAPNKTVDDYKNEKKLKETLQKFKHMLIK